MGHEMAAGDIVSGVEQQPHVHIGSDERVSEIQVRELIAFLSCGRSEDETGQMFIIMWVSRGSCAILFICRTLSSLSARSRSAAFPTMWLNEKKCVETVEHSENNVENIHLIRLLG